MRVNGTVKVKKQPGCFTRVIQVFIVFVIISAFAGATNDNEDSSSNGTTIQETHTAKATAAPTMEPTAAHTVEPTIAPTAAPFTIYLEFPNLGEYGRYYTFNENVEKAEESDKHTVIQCFVPAGTYIVTNEGKYPTYVHCYSAETVYTDDGWEEPRWAYGSSRLDVGDSCKVTVKSGYYIKLLDNDIFKLVALNITEEYEADYEEIANDLETLMKDKDIFDYVEVETDEEGFYFNFANEGYADLLYGIKAQGDVEYNEEYWEFSDAVMQLYDEVYQYITENYANPNHVFVNVLDEKNHEKTLLTVVNGYDVYNYFAE